MKNNKGFTLIEVILAIAIIGIIAIPIFGIFGIGVKNIVSAGNRTEDVFTDQKSIINEINREYSEINNPDGEKEIDIKFSDDLTIKIQGKVVTTEDDDIEIKTFVPKPQP